MNEVNAISTTKAGLVRTSVLLAGREAGGQHDSGFTSPPPLAGRRCPICGARHTLESHKPGCRMRKFLPWGTGERSGPANVSDQTRRA